MAEASKTGQKVKDRLAGKNAPAVIPKNLVHSKSADINLLLSRYAAQISQALPKHVTAERVIQLCTTVIARNPKIKECTLETILGSVMQSSILGLDVTPQFGQFFFIPRRNGKTKEMECTALIGYKGYLQLMRRSGEVATVYSFVVREGDFFDLELGLTPKLVHRPAEDGGGNMTHAYAVIKFKNGGEAFEVLRKSDVMKAKARSEAKNSTYSPWNTEDEESMWRKTAIRKLANYAPLSAEFMTATVADGVALKPSMFDPNTKQVNAIEIEPDDIELIEPPKPDETPKKEAEELKEEGGFTKRIMAIYDEFVGIKANQEFLNVLGGLGYESVAEIPEDGKIRAAVINSLSLKLGDLKKAK